MPLFFLFARFLKIQKNLESLMNTKYAKYHEVGLMNLDYIMVDLDILVTKLQKLKYIKTFQQKTKGNAFVRNQVSYCKQVQGSQKNIIHQY